MQNQDMTLKEAVKVSIMQVQRELGKKIKDACNQQA